MSAPNQYVKFFPTTSGTSANNLGLGVTDPSAEPFSVGKEMDDLSKDTRVELESRYADFKKAFISLFCQNIHALWPPSLKKFMG